MQGLASVWTQSRLRSAQTSCPPRKHSVPLHSAGTMKGAEDCAWTRAGAEGEGIAGGMEEERDEDEYGRH